MAMEEIIARLGLDSSGFKRGLDAAEAGVSKFRAVVQDIGAKIAAAFTAGALLNLAKEAVAHAAAMKDSANATQTGAQEYQALAAIVRTSGAEIQQLNTGLASLTTRSEDAANGNKQLQKAFATLNIDVMAFNALPTERKLEAIGQAYVAAGESQAAYAAVTDLLGLKAGPKLMETLQKLGTEGFDVLAAKAGAAGLVLDEIALERITHLEDTFKNWKIATLVYVDQVIVAWDNLVRSVFSKRSAEEVLMDDLDPDRARARVEAVAQLTEEAWNAHLDRMAELGSRRNPYYDESKAYQKVIKETAEDIEAIERRTSEILVQEAMAQGERARQSEQLATTVGAITASEMKSAANAEVLKSLEAGRAVLRLKEMTDKERLAELELLHSRALLDLANSEGDLTMSKKDQEEIVKRVLDLEKQIGDTRGKIADAETKAGADREKKQKDLLELIKEQAELQAQIDQAAFNQYGRTSGDIASGSGSNSTLGRQASEAERLAEVAQRQFDELSRARARAAGGDQDAARELARLEEQFNRTETDRRAAVDAVTSAQGGETGTVQEQQLERLTVIKKEITELNEKLNSA